MTLLVWGHDFKVATRSGIQVPESGSQITMGIFRKFVANRFKRKSTESASQTNEIAIDFLGVTATVLQMMAQRRKRRAQRVKKPVVRNVQSRSAKLKSAGTQPERAGGFDLLLNGLRQSVQQQNQAFTGADAQTGRNELGVADESPVTVAENAGDRK